MNKLQNAFPVVLDFPRIVMDADGNEWLIRPGGEPRPILSRNPFVAQFPPIENIAAGGAGNPVIMLFDSGMDFLWQEGVYEYDLTEEGGAVSYEYSTRPMPNILISLSDSMLGRTMNNNPVPVGAWFGAVEKPIRRSLPYLFGGAATAKVDSLNFGQETAHVLRLSLIGQQILYKG